MKPWQLALSVVGVAIAVATLAFIITPKQGSFLQSSIISEDYLEFIEFLVKHGKVYSTSQEFMIRQNLFYEAKKNIEIANSREGITHKLGLNKFADWTDEEYKSLLKNKPEPVQRIITQHSHYKVGELPQKVDWREQNAVNPIQDQGKCSSSYAFSAVATIEGHHAINQGVLMKFSEQQIIDCTGGDYKCEGCSGGRVSDTLRYNYYYGMMNGSYYPYRGYDQTCLYDKSKATVFTKSIEYLSTRSITDLFWAVTIGPVSVSIDASSDDFRYYKHGIFTGFCTADQLTHALTVVGYDITRGYDTGYFIVRNSWGVSWGEDGYIRMAVSAGDGVCGMLIQPLYPITD
ncbi:hypothetical protein FGO68_gene7536 [Halteria grandinella]|uniref:Uncharacterized protein n=1 Tax=Halteria grandinella TaxID=5974 RepID=A0A8J8NLW1_HALGN|nr:hypothetical protein FGO68_gene7536 [Halteria grandinella]